MLYLPGNAQHIGGRHSQQDSFGFGDPDDGEFIRHGGFVAVVCDGMGGMEYGDAASRTAARAFLEAYQTKSADESIPDALERSVREANGQVVALAQSLGMSEGIGTTLVAAVLSDHSLYYISVGDSAIFHCTNGECYTLNHPHVFANILDAAVARGTLSREDADHHPERDSLTSFIGAEILEEIDRNVEPYPLDLGDTILLASDGLFKTLDASEIRACMQGAPQRWPDALVERTLAKQREHQDNVTVLSVTIEPDGAHADVPSPSARTAVRQPASMRAPSESTALPPEPAPTTIRISEAAAPPPVRQPRPMAPASPAAPASRPFWPLLVALFVFAAGLAGWTYWKHRPTRGVTANPTVTDPSQARPAPPPVNSPAEDKPDPTVRQPAPVPK